MKTSDKKDTPKVISQEKIGIALFILLILCLLPIAHNLGYRKATNEFREYRSAVFKEAECVPDHFTYVEGEGFIDKTKQVHVLQKVLRVPSRVEVNLDFFSGWELVGKTQKTITLPKEFVETCIEEDKIRRPSEIMHLAKIKIKKYYGVLLADARERDLYRVTVITDGCLNIDGYDNWLEDERETLVWEREKPLLDNEQITYKVINGVPEKVLP